MIVSLVLVLLGTVFRAAKDTITHHFDKSIFSRLDPNFWNPAKSWKNKYDQRVPQLGPAFFGSTTFLVFTTDGWHLMQFGMLSCYQLAVIVQISESFGSGLAMFLTAKVVSGVLFEWLYGGIFLKKY